MEREEEQHANWHFGFGVDGRQTRNDLGTAKECPGESAEEAGRRDLFCGKAQRNEALRNEDNFRVATIRLDKEGA